MPIPDYSINVPDPGERLLSGLNIGQGIANIVEQRRLAQAEQTRQAALTQAMTNLVEMERPNFSDYEKVIIQLPKEQAEGMRKNWELKSKEYQSGVLRSAGQILAAFDASPELAIKMMEERSEAEKNAGNTEAADVLSRWAEVAKINPDRGKKTMGMMVATLPGGKEIIESISKIGVEERKEKLQPGVLDKQAADLGLTKAQTNKILTETKKLGIESKKAVMELEALKKGEADPEKKFDQEKKLRDEYNKRTTSFVSGKKNYNIINSSAEDKSGAGDVALITAFMKMLDEGSVVRETEFANARDTAGLLTQLTNAAQKVRTGEFLTDTQRAGFARLAKQYLNAAEKEQQSVKRDLGVVVKNYALNEENVFGLPEEEVVEEEVATAEVPAAGAVDIRSRADAILGGL